MIATTGSLAAGVVNTTCSWAKLFLMADLREVPCGPFLGLRRPPSTGLFLPPPPPPPFVRGFGSVEQSGKRGRGILGFRGRKGLQGLMGWRTTEEHNKAVEVICRSA
ncbi:hypothetical protein B296_00019051 [Ensete ventricosum]|uniref:Uncharacterized protein n=1 Tax=Ensete ventricosum TaxID=4639 RepID=A0A427AAI8_ENSVE|nr:hypothetical protein B296_00019051 [Ensete ventricosum]